MSFEEHHEKHCSGKVSKVFVLDVSARIEAMKTVQNEVATFGAGCFWGVEEAFRVMPGVTGTAVGYCGGTTENPSYEQVCTDATGHAEVVQITFDPAKISYQKLLDAFFNLHNPTTLNYQGPDFGSQYRSVIFFHSPEQEKLAKATVERESENNKWGGRPIVTQIVAAQPFYAAEEYHQQYLMKRGLGSCNI